MPHPAKKQDPVPSSSLHRSVDGGPNKATTKKGTASRINPHHARAPTQPTRRLCMRAADGAGGKGSWGKADEAHVEAPLDPNDPNYDPDEHVNPNETVLEAK